MGLNIPDKTVQAFSLFIDGEFGDPAQGSFTNRLRAPIPDSAGQSILSYTDGEPALIQCNNHPPLIFWLAPLSSECSDWATQQAFLPFFGELIHSIRSQNLFIAPDTTLPGEPLSFKNVALFEKVELRDGTGTDIPLTRINTGGDGFNFVTEPIAAPGIYRLCTSRECLQMRMVNFPAAESDLRASPPPAIINQSARMMRNAKELSAAREGTPLWKILIWVAICFIGFECVLVWLLFLEDKRLAEGTS
jgi:hypothetical protein